MKILYTLITLTFSALIFGQTGMGTPTPRGALDINRPLTNTFGLVLPTNSNTANMVNPQGGAVAEGTIMYDSAAACIKVYDGSNWSNCLFTGAASPVLTADCALGFQGTITSGRAIRNASFRITVTSTSLASSGTISFQVSDLVLSGVSGITVSSVTPNSVTLNAGETKVITYSLRGTPLAAGTLTGAWSNIGLSCANSITVL